MFKRILEFFLPGEVPGPLTKNIMEKISTYNTIQEMWPLGKPLGNSSQVNTPVKADKNKLDWSLLPMEALEPVVEVLEFGKTKYSAWNWSEGSGFKWTRVSSATLRHIFAWMKGEDLDPETHKSHLAHAVCNLIFLLYYIQNKDRYINDDRNKR